MKILLAAVNAKYIHSNLAVYCLKSYAASKGQDAEIAEYTINQQTGDVLRDLYERNADVVAFSCYIWNIEFIKTVICDYKKLRPKSEIWLGGPEVSYRAEEILTELPEVRGVMVGEGEETFAKLTALYKKAEGSDVCYTDCETFGHSIWSSVNGIVLRDDTGVIFGTEPALPPDFSRLPFPYGEEIPASFENRIIYYESSRGCPFSCAYCLSAIDKRVRFRDMDLVKQELRFFLDKQVPQIKFIDRTFNINVARTIELLQFIKENDNGITNFHFEVAAELLTKEQIEILNSLRPGLVQLEIGVQSANKATLALINRKTGLTELKKTVAAVRKKNNVHIHLDLIAGLPKEDLESFKHSFNEVYCMNPHQLQLGFLKVLSGAPMEEMAAENEIVYQKKPPYEVLFTRWLSYDDIILLKKVEELVEVYTNSGQFVYSMMYLQHFVCTPFELFERLARFYDENNYAGLKLSRNKRYEILWEFAEREILTTEMSMENPDVVGEESIRRSAFSEILFFDYCLREKPKSRPGFVIQTQMDKQTLKEVYASLKVKREEEGMHDIETFSFEPARTAKHGKIKGKPCHVLFSYGQREAMYGGALWQSVESRKKKKNV